MRYIALILIITFFCISCNNTGRPLIPSQNGADTLHTTKATALPFIGKRRFETRPGVSGTGTPGKTIELKANGDVFFSFWQQNQADKNVTDGRYYAGKYSRYLRCYFKEWNDEVTYYEIVKDTIYQVDSAHNRLESNECCGLTDDRDKCGCQGELYEVEE